MCDYSLHFVASRPARVGDKLVLDPISYLADARLCRDRRTRGGRLPAAWDRSCV